MILEMFILFEIIMLVFFGVSFYTKQEVMWVVTLVLSGALMYSSWGVSRIVYAYNSTLSAYVSTEVFYSYPVISAINLIFLALSIIFGIYDLFDKYGNKFAS